MSKANGINTSQSSDGVATRSAALIGAELVALFERVGQLPDKVQWVHRHVARDLPGELDPTLDGACAVVAATIDAQAAAFDGNPYHNRQHFCEVALTAHALCFLERLDVESTQFVLLAALIHDFVHDGGAHPAFVQERASLELTRPLLQAAGLTPVQIGRIAALVLATDTSEGTAFMAAACQAHAAGTTVAAPLPLQAPELSALVIDPELARLARILCEADILPSIGLTTAHGLRLQQRLAREWRRPLDHRDKLAFIEHVLKQGYVGDFFMPNVQAARETVGSSSHASGEG